mmetsp:Transcript_24032/g.72087  ORF Transcript_24032/g.72087 Transcript_24032/m.72087 type:complete len:184 (-) Transcript_24032:70-621(-)
MFGRSEKLDEVQAIRGLNADFVALGCGDADSTPCANIRAAMRTLGLEPKAPAPPAPVEVALSTPKITATPPLLVKKADADAAARCGRRCGVLGALLGAGLSNMIPPAADPEGEALSQAAAAAASVAAVSLCSSFCNRARAETVPAPGACYELAGTYTHRVSDLNEVEAFADAVAKKRAAAVED